ncbi:hypothetical protein D3C77_272190 [compost metagenome]
MFDLFLEGFRVFIAQHLVVDGVLAQLLGQPLARGFAFDVSGRRLVAGDDGALVTHACLTEQLVALAGLEDAAGHQHGIAPAISQTMFGGHVEEDVGDDLLQP